MREQLCWKRSAGLRQGRSSPRGVAESNPSHAARRRSFALRALSAQPSRSKASWRSIASVFMDLSRKNASCRSIGSRAISNRVCIRTPGSEALDKVHIGEMPSKEEPRPCDEIAAFVVNLNSLLKAGRAARIPSSGAILAQASRFNLAKDTPFWAY